MFAHLGSDQFHYGGTQMLEVCSILGRRSGQHIVVIFMIPSDLCILLLIGKLDKRSIFFHDFLDALPSNSNDAFVVDFRYMERNFGWDLLVQIL